MYLIEKVDRYINQFSGFQTNRFLSLLKVIRIKIVLTLSKP